MKYLIICFSLFLTCCSDDKFLTCLKMQSEIDAKWENRYNLTHNELSEEIHDFLGSNKCNAITTQRLQKLFNDMNAIKN